jgi:ferredoxin/flavodoxin
MKTVLYYFSATGNALAVAKRIRERLEDCELSPIPRVMARADGTREEIEGSVIGIVCPIYMHNMPHIVSRFVEKIVDADYLFMVYAGGGELGRGLRKTRKLFSRRGLALSALFNIPTPSNYTPYGYPDESLQTARFADADRAIDRITEVVINRADHFDGSKTAFFAANVHPGLLNQLGYSFMPKMDGYFSVENQCTGCGICEKICPVGNISMCDSLPVLNHRCEQCYTCLQWCPAQAIQYGK